MNNSSRIHKNIPIAEWEIESCQYSIYESDFKCSACGQPNISFLFLMLHPTTRREISVGVECARVMAREGWQVDLYKTEAKRREKWRRYYGWHGPVQITEQHLIERGKL